MGIETMAIAGLGASALGGLLGARNQNQQANRNYNAQQAQQAWLQNMGTGMMQQGPNPFAQMMQNFVGQNPTMQQFTPGDAFTYNPATLAQAPGITPGTIQAPGSVQVPQVQGAQVASATPGEGFNVGQDSLMQMMRRQFGPSADMGIGSAIQDIMGNNTFDASKVISALEPIDQRMLSQQVSDLRGSVGSLGQRFGTDLFQNEAMLRENTMQNIGARNAGLVQDAYNQGQARRLQAVGLGQQQQQFLTQLPFQAAALQQQAAGQLQQGALGVAGLQQQANLAGAGNQQQASLANAGNALQAQGIDIGAIMQAALANQQTGLQGQQFNASQAAQANLANMNSMNQAGQFNAAQQTQNQQFNAQQGNLYNQLIMQALGQAGGFQQQQQAMNNQIFGILGGQQVPQQTAPGYGGAISDIGSYMMLPWMFNQSMGARPSAQPWTPIGYNPNPTYNFPTNLF